MKLQKALTNRKEIEEWVKSRVYQRKINEITELIYILSKSEKIGEWPVFSSFPGNLESEVSYKNSIFENGDGDGDGKDYPHGLILKLIKCLSPTQVAIFCLRYIDEKTQESVARTLGCSHQYISQQEKRIKAIFSRNKYVKEIINKGNYGDKES